MTGGTDINRAAIARRDPSVSRIIGTASQVALYKFVGTGEQWEKTDIEGCLFIYERSAKPRYNFLIMNRQNPADYIEPVTTDLEINLDPPYLFYRKHSQTEPNGTIRGLWFYKEEDSTNTAHILRRLIEEMLTGEKGESGSLHQPELPSSHGGRSAFKQVARQQRGSGDIMTLLSKAQSEYATSSTAKGGKSGAEGGGGEQTTSRPKALAATVGGRKVVKPTPVRVITRRDQTQGKTEEEGPQVLSALFAQSASLSDPSTGTRTGQKDSYGSGSVPGMPDMLQRLLSCPGGESEDPVLPPPPPGKNGVLGKIRAEELEKDLRMESLRLVAGKKESGLIPPEDFESSVLSSYKNESSVALDLPVFNSTPTKTSTDSFWDDGVSSLCESKELLTPADLLSGNLQGRPASCSGIEGVKDRVHRVTERGDIPDITPLTKDQMLQALTYMLKNDSSFVSQLHENYVKSLNETFLQRHKNHMT